MLPKSLSPWVTTSHMKYVSVGPFAEPNPAKANGTHAHYVVQKELMNSRQFNAAIILAKTSGDVSMSHYEGDKFISGVPEVFFGCALRSFQPVPCTIEEVSRLIRYQCAQFNGGWDMVEMEHLREIARTKFVCYGDPVQDKLNRRKEEREQAKQDARNAAIREMQIAEAAQAQKDKAEAERVKAESERTVVDATGRRRIRVITDR